MSVASRALPQRSLRAPYLFLTHTPGCKIVHACHRLASQKYIHTYTQLLAPTDPTPKILFKHTEGGEEIIVWKRDDTGIMIQAAYKQKDNLLKKTFLVLPNMNVTQFLEVCVKENDRICVCVYICLMYMHMYIYLFLCICICTYKYFPSCMCYMVCV